MSITVRYGVNNEVKRDAGAYPTVDKVLNDADLKQFLGFGSNVEARVNGTSDVSRLTDGDEVDIVSRANTKG